MVRIKFSGKNYEHRRQWVVDRLKELSSIFAFGNMRLRSNVEPLPCGSSYQQKAS